MRVLVVEDDSAVRSLYRRSLSTWGHEVDLAANGKEGLDLFRRHRPELTIADIEMPEMDGLTMFREIRRLSADALVLVVTGKGTETVAVNALRLGAANYLKKPVALNELQSQIQKYAQVVDHREMGQTVSQMVQHVEMSVVVDSRIDLVGQVVERLLEPIRGAYDLANLTSMRLGLFELLVNAIEHGNWGISAAEKHRAIETQSIGSLYEARRSDALLTGRKVTVDLSFRRDHGAEWIIRDEGDGFDHAARTSPFEQGDLLSPSGRGIFLTRMQFDELEYLGSGNTVRAFKARA